MKSQATLNGNWSDDELAPRGLTKGKQPQIHLLYYHLRNVNKIREEEIYQLVYASQFAVFLALVKWTQLEKSKSEDRQMWMKTDLSPPRWPTIKFCVKQIRKLALRGWTAESCY